MTEPIQISVTPFDNEISLLYKVGDFYRQPTKYIIVRPATETDVNVVPIIKGLAFIPIIDLIEAIIEEPIEPGTVRNPGELLQNIYETVSSLSPSVPVNDIVMLYDSVARTRQTLEEIFVEVQAFFNVLNQRKQISHEKEIRHGIDVPQMNLGFRDASDLEYQYGVWTTQFGTQLEQDHQILLRIEEIQQILQSRTPLPVSPLIFENVMVGMSPRLNGNVVSPDDGIDIFNASQANLYVPYIQYNSERTAEGGQKYYKIYRGSASSPAPNYEDIIPLGAKTGDPDHIYMIIWAEDGDIRKAPKDSFMRCNYNLKTNYLTVSSPITETRNESIVISRVAEALPNLTLGSSTEIKVRGTFYIYNFEISEVSLLDLILNDPLMNTYLYVEESIFSYAQKKRLYIHYKSLFGSPEEGETVTGEGYISNSASVSAKLKQYYTQSGVIYIQETPQGPVQITLAAGTPYLQVRLTKADSREVARQFVEIFRRLMDYYREKRAEVDQLYRFFIHDIATLEPQIKVKQIPANANSLSNTGSPPPTPRSTGSGVSPEVLSEMSTPRSIASSELPASPSAGIPGYENVVIPSRMNPNRKRGDTKINQLKDLAPDLFVNGFARKCQRPLQVTPVPPDEVIDLGNGNYVWKDHTFLRGTTVLERQVMAFPPDNPRFYFACLSDSNPYPGVKKNKDLPNAGVYPYIPCCFSRNQMDPNSNSNYNVYYRGKKKDIVQTSRLIHKIKGDRVLDPGKIGMIPESISNLLRRYSEEVVKIVRYGVPRSLNSLIHCVCVALDNPDYLSRPLDQREDYVMEVRQHILATINPSLLKQELYDYTDEEIYLQLSDTLIFFDPNLYYRALEETFDINLYVFAPVEDPTGSLGRIDLPRFKLFHVRPYRPDRQTVLIFKHYGTGLDILGYPQCELIIDYDEDNNTSIKSFGVEMTELVHTAIMEIHTTISWTIDEIPPASPETTSEEPTSIVVARKNFFSQINMNQFNPNGQLIDNYGKMRALLIYTDNTAEDGAPITLTIPSSQPENLPVFTELYPAPVERVIDYFGEPIAVTRSENNVNGFWYPLLDIPTGVFIPVEPTTQYSDKPEGPSNPIESTGINVVDRIKRLRKTLNIILQLIRWIFIVAQLTNAMEPLMFVQNYFAVGPETSDSSTYYDFSKLQRKLPTVNSVEEGMRYLETHVPTFVYEGKFIMYSEGFAVKILGKLEEFYKISKPLPISDTEDTWTLPTQIDGLFEDETDFVQQPNVSIFVNERDLRLYLKSISRPGYQSIVIKDRLDISLGLEEEPYLYIAPPIPPATEGKIYLIQNVNGGDKLRAISVADTWARDKINLGPQAPFYEGTPPPYIVYGISTAATPVILENAAIGAENYLQLLDYRSRKVSEELEIEGRYSAMLPLL